MSEERQVPPGIYVVEVPSHPVKTRYVVIAMTGSEAAEIVAFRALPNAALEIRKRHSAEYEVARLGTYDPGMEGSKYPAIVAWG